MTELETRLRALRDDLDLPATTDLAPGVLARLEPGSARARSWRRRLVLALALLLAVGAAVLAASPGARSALRDLLGLGGVTVVRADELPRPGAPPGFLPGRPVSVAEARDAIGFELLLPDVGAPPRRVLLDETVSGGAVSFVWCCDPTLQLTQVAGTSTFVYVTKVVGPEAEIEPVDVDGRPGYWIRGAPHAVRFVDRSGRFHEAATRLAGDVLLWADGDVTLRLEGDVTRDEAIAIARTLR